MQALRHFLLALQFFTRIPVTGAVARWVGFSPDMQRASMGHFPGVGLLVGSVAAGVFTLSASLLGGGVAYTLGTFFYHRPKMPYSHAVWHMFVIAGSVCHYIAVMAQVVSVR